MDASRVLSVISIISGVFPVAAALYNYKHLDNTLKIVALFFLVSLGFDGALALVYELGWKNSLPFIHLFIAVSVVFWAAIYFQAFFGENIKKAVIILSGVVFVIVILDCIFSITTDKTGGLHIAYNSEAILQYPSISNTVSGILFIFFSLAYFYQLLNRQEFIHIEKQGLFWVNAGVLFYFALNVFLFMLFGRIIKARLQEYYAIHNVTNIIANVLYSVGLLCKPQKTT